MISYLQGVLVAKSPTEIVMDVNGVGYAVHIPLSTFEKLDGLNQRVKIYTHLHVREDAMLLYGFATETERELFRMLISVSGIGPKIAQGILSGMDASELRRCITSGDASALTSIPGVGRKTAERIVLELRDKVAKGADLLPGAPAAQVSARSEALAALLSLGYTRATAEQALRRVLKEAGEDEISLEELLKRALRYSSP